MDELLHMSPKEITRLEVMQRLKEKRVRQKEAAHLLGLSVRQVKRLWRQYRQAGAKGLISAGRGTASSNRLDVGVVKQALDLLKEKYSDFGPTLAHEKLVEIDHIQNSQVHHAGFVRFEENRDGSAHITAQMNYVPPASALGHAVAQLLVVGPRQALHENLIRLKSLSEDGETSAEEGGKVELR